MRLLGAGAASGLPDPERQPDLCARLGRAALPLVEIQTSGSGRLGTSGKRHVDGAVARDLRYAGHEEHREGVASTLLVHLLSRLPIQSVTDQQDFRLLPAIAAAAPTAVTPEQGAIWAYPLPEHTEADLGTVMTSALLGRIHLSGRPDLLTERQLDVVRRAVDTYKTYRHLLPAARLRRLLATSGCSPAPAARPRRLLARAGCSPPPAARHLRPLARAGRSPAPAARPARPARRLDRPRADP